MFPDMIKRSVPGYPTIVAMTGVLAERYAKANTTIYDLGCSLGESLRAAESAVKTDSCALVGIDNSEAMIKRARQQFEGYSRIEWRLDDITTAPLETAQSPFLNHLQFISIDQRLELCNVLDEHWCLAAC